MEILRVILIVLEIFCCLLLIGVILLQQSKSQGMGMAFGGGMGESLFGSRAGNILTKTTVTLGIVFLVNTTFLGILYTTNEERSLVESAPVAAPAPIAAPAPGPGMMTQPVEPTGVPLAPTPAPAPVVTSETTLETAPAAVETAPVAVEMTPTEAPAASEPAAEPVSP